VAHHTYRTEGFILGSVDAGDASRYLFLFTRELGFVCAHIRSAREMRSKLRYHTQEQTLATVALVRGRGMWRLTNAVEMCNATHALREKRDARAALARVSFLVRQLLHGEERNEYLFAALSAMLSFMSSTTLTERDIQRVEYITVLRVLFSLGYLEEKAAFAGFLQDPVFTEVLLEAMGEHERQAVAAINASLKATQL